jgi:hypothetical protein
MTWSEAYEAMRNGRYMRRASWEENAVIRIFKKDGDNKSYLYCTPKTYQYFDQHEDGGYTFKDKISGDDWEIFPYKYNFDNNTWYWVG